VDHTPGRQGGRIETTLLAEAYYHGFGKRRQTTLLNERARYHALTTKKQEKLEAQARRRSASTPASYTPEFTPPLGVSGGIPHIRITTAFSHPIKFNYIPDPKGTSPCSWCAQPFFGQYGHEEIEVEVVPFPSVNGHGYEEMPGGHADGGFPRTQMCIECTFERVDIMGCEKHVLQPIDVDPRWSVREEMQKSMLAIYNNDEVGGQLVREAKWCAICPQYASFKCCARQPEDALISNDTEGRGCGLYLCVHCQDLMAKISDTGFWNTSEVLDRTIHCAKNDRFNYESGVRADASFLTSTGELMVRIQKGMGEGVVVGGEDEGGSSGGREVRGREMRRFGRFWRGLGRGRGSGVRSRNRHLLFRRRGWGWISEYAATEASYEGRGGIEAPVVIHRPDYATRAN